MLVATITVNHTGFDDVKKNLLDNDCHHQKMGENVNVRIQIIQG